MAIRCHHSQSEATQGPLRGHSEATRRPLSGPQRAPQRPSEGIQRLIRGNQRPVRGHQRPLRGTQWHSEALRGPSARDVHRPWLCVPRASTLSLTSAHPPHPSPTPLLAAACHVQGGNTPLHWAAAYSSSVAVVQALLAAYPEAATATDEVRRPHPAACIRGHQRPSEVIRGNQGQSGVIIRNQRPLRGHSVALSGPLRGHQRHSEVIRDHSEALRGTQRAPQCAMYTAPGSAYRVQAPCPSLLLTHLIPHQLLSSPLRATCRAGIHPFTAPLITAHRWRWCRRSSRRTRRPPRRRTLYAATRAAPHPCCRVHQRHSEVLRGTQWHSEGPQRAMYTAPGSAYRVQAPCPSHLLTNLIPHPLLSSPLRATCRAGIHPFTGLLRTAHRWRWCRRSSRRTRRPPRRRTRYAAATFAAPHPCCRVHQRSSAVVRGSSEVINGNQVSSFALRGQSVALRGHSEATLRPL